MKWSEIPTVGDHALARQGRDRELEASPHRRAPPSDPDRLGALLTSGAARDLALIQTLGGAGLRSHEARALPTDPFDPGRSDNRGGGMYLRVQGKGHKVRAVPLCTDVVDEL